MGKHAAKSVKRKYKKGKSVALTIFSLLLLFTVGFFIGGKISENRNVIVGAANTTKDENKSADNSTSKEENKNKQNIKKKGETFDPYKKDGRKVAYLTFDDGPSLNNTPKILDILKQNNVKATFFVIGECAANNTELVKREVSEGHVVGNHTYSHEMHKIYSNPQVFISDLDKGDKLLKSIIGADYNLKLIRFPGGSFGSKLNPFKEEAKKAGYHYVDWNDLTGDAERPCVPVNALMNKLKSNTVEEHVVILMHDAPAKNTTVQALPQVIEFLKSKGYTFETLK